MQQNTSQQEFVQEIQSTNESGQIAEMQTNQGCRKSRIAQKIQEKQNQTLQFQSSDFIPTMTGPYTQYYMLDDNQLIGKGGFGQVFKVRCLLNNEIRAMKVIKKQLGKSSSSFREEFEVLKQQIQLLDHPHILKLYHSFEDDSNYYIISELCEGGTLLDYILAREQSCDENEICKIMWQLMSAVSSAHGQKIIHRDIKPENILIEYIQESLQLKLIDWGMLYKDEKKEDRLKECCGTAHYVAPEIYGQRYDEKVDIWSCGVVCFMLVSHDPPFQGKDSKEILAKVYKGCFDFKYKCWSRVSEELKDLISHMLVKDPQQRFSAQEVLQHRWFKQQVKESFPISSQEFKQEILKLTKLTSKTQNQSIKRVNSDQSIVEKPESISSEQRFVRGVLLYISVQLVHKKQKGLQQKIFQKIDCDSDGTISKQELKVALRLAQPELCSQDIEINVDKVFDILDLNQNGSIDYSEFISATLNLDKQELEKNIDMAFDFFDVNKDGVITIDELTKMFANPSTVDCDQTLQDLFDSLDSNKDKQISLEEFKSLIFNYQVNDP